ncbi:WecB/TagA/CpsF family glycosyltransferase [Sedimentibacter sp. zth1]|uniref:WecB/TagA/CpsF family glycosyltransferase n=1 Tax=Sedimentibacter sp. zth1 TaxID=2816908 RepID=UPI001A91F6B3|nr:WecB/TagA/CpsF family glycosyltransferase [Sedimentibacter sp. zth1]QSX06128.1 WecB/TagA/CpsF family glycosyltransferase [Sedimentibacter sp. zth1]
MDKINIMGTRINNINMEEAVKMCDDTIDNNEKFIIYTPNSEIIMIAKDDDEFRNLLNNSDINIPDGIGLIYASKIKKMPLKEKVAGYDLSFNLIKLANKKKLKLYIVGGKPGVAQKAAQKINEKYPNVNVAGTNDGYFKGTHLGMPGHEEEKKVIQDINSKSPDILFVGFGAKKQEQWIETNKDKIDCKVFIGNGGTIDGIAGNVKRAPDIFIKLGLEWFYRLMKDPSRIKRQILLPKFMLAVMFGGKNVVKESK